MKFQFELEVKPNQGGWSIEKGTYRLHIAIAATNALVKREVLEIKFSGEWIENEGEMFSRGIQIMRVAALDNQTG